MERRQLVERSLGAVVFGGYLGENARVDGIYDADPRTNPGATRFERLDYGEYLSRGLKVMDATAISLCRDNRLPVVVFELMEPGNVVRAVRGEPIGTLVCAQEP